MYNLKFYFLKLLLLFIHIIRVNLKDINKFLIYDKKKVSHSRFFFYTNNFV